MNHQTDEILRLSGEDSKKFARAYFKPTNEMMNYFNNVMDQINDNIAINRNENGFEAEIEGLDLSFLDEIKIVSTNTINRNVRLDIKLSDKINLKSNVESMTIPLKKKYDEYCDVKNSEFTPLAA